MPLMAFSDLEKRKNKNFLEKYNAGGRANIEQKPYEASLSQFMTSTKPTHSPTSTPTNLQVH